MVWPTDSLSKTNFDAGTDIPKDARAQLEALYDHVKLISAEVDDGATVWHSGNDGAASGLDADLLDGQHGSYYRDASNLNAGTVPLARLPIGGGSGLDADLLDGLQGSYFLDLNNHTGNVAESQIQNDAVTQAKIAAGAVGQSEVKIATSDTSLACGSGTTTSIKDMISAYGLYYVSAGGGFCLSTELRVTSPSAWRDVFSLIAFNSAIATSSVGVQPRVLTGQTTGSLQTATARDVYINASPPHSIGGLAFGEQFIFILLDDSGEVKSVWTAPDAPWIHNGPTVTRPCRVIKDVSKPGGLKKFVRKLILPPNYDILPKPVQLRALAKATVEEVEIDESIKNADMGLIPNPFFETDENRIILLEPDDKAYYDLTMIQKNGGSIADVIHGGYMKLDLVSKVGDHQKPKNTKMIKVRWKQ